MKKWELQMADEWDDHEAFRSLPKPKKQFGNEAAEIVWPYAVLLENVIKVHPFTKSIYCYYGQHQLTEEGRAATKLAITFARECMIPITFHNPQCYVETEMLLEFNDTPWLAIHCLDGRTVTMAIEPPEADGRDPKAALLEKVLKQCDKLARGSKDARSMFRLLNERPNQNHYLRINYQWFGERPEDRMTHQVQWVQNPDDASVMKVPLEDIRWKAADWIQAEDGREPRPPTAREKYSRAKGVAQPGPHPEYENKELAEYNFKRRMASGTNARFSHNAIRDSWRKK